MTRFYWITSVLAFLLLALVVSLVHFGRPVVKHVTKIVVVGNSTMSASACRSIRMREPESEVHALYGASPNGDGRPTDARTIWVTYQYDADYYAYGGPDQECDVFYGPKHRVSTVWEELIP